MEEVGEEVEEEEVEEGEEVVVHNNCWQVEVEEEVGVVEQLLELGC